MGIFSLGVFFGVLLTLGINKLFEKNNFKEEEFEKSLQELEVGSRQLYQKCLDLYIEVEQMRGILRKNGFEKDVDIPSTLHTLNDKIENIRLNYEFDRKTNSESISGLTQDVMMVKKYVTRIAANNEY
jgi:hypothetical protein